MLLCGGEERGTWLLERGIASDRTFAFALGAHLVTRRMRWPGSRSMLYPPTTEAIDFTLPEFFDALVARRPLDCVAAPGITADRCNGASNLWNEFSRLAESRPELGLSVSFAPATPCCRSYLPAAAASSELGYRWSLMPEQRAHSRAYLTALHGKPPSLRQVYRHFFAFEEFLLLRLRVAQGAAHRGELAPDATGFHALRKTGEPALLGTFHFGHSDLTGFLLGRQEQRRVFMVRQRVGNSHDTEMLGAQFAQWVKFIWVNEPENLLFALKDAVAAGGSVALKCDRLEFSAKTEAFDFLGAKRCSRSRFITWR